MLNLIIVGNGFDLAHGINSNYFDFKNYLLEKKDFSLTNSMYLTDRESFFANNKFSDKITLLEKLEKYINSEQLWSDFEAALGELDYESLLDDNACYLIDYGDDEWRDSDNHTFQLAIQEDLNFVETLQHQLKNWIQSLDTYVSPLPSILNIIEKYKSKNLHFISFNYTSTLENVYNVNSEKILYIHGKPVEKEPLIFGHHSHFHRKSSVEKITDKPIDEETIVWQLMHDRDSQERDFREIEGEKIVEQYFKKTYKNTRKNILFNSLFFSNLTECENIYVLGHSLSNIDFDYFQEIRKNVNDKCRWYFSAYSTLDRERAIQLIKELSIKEHQIITI